VLHATTGTRIRNASRLVRAALAAAALGDGSPGLAYEPDGALERVEVSP